MWHLFCPVRFEHSAAEFFTGRSLPVQGGRIVLAVQIRSEGLICDAPSAPRGDIGILQLLYLSQVYLGNDHFQ